jgi:alpha,alpha-trehalase
MRLSRLILVAAVATFVVAFQPGSATAQQAAAPDPDATLRYIYSAWDSLTRSVTDCNSLADVKVEGGSATNPVLYLPADFPAPPSVTALEQSCHVRVVSLPRRIEKLGDVRPEELPTPGLLYLPNPYIVPGGRFNEMYGWYSYFILLGLEADHR